ncbi:Beta-galactosidase 12 [Hibiscus syriacus]|uniref:beta-galactosidase n=1 Tax=Hibiscus syriacus TaxID=106335 RepID=A0A6A2YQ95_HIBSY|nr:Beta-galactosidase 12 [Hibiscus syriacus]
MLSFCYTDFSYNYLEGTIPSECASMNLTFASTVTYDSRAIVIDGKHRVLVSGSIHYPRNTTDMWSDLIQKSKDGGLYMIETYDFWNLHKPVRNQYNFEVRNDLVKFVKLFAATGLYVHQRIRPYVCAEWNYGGFPLWLHFITGIKFRTDNEPFKAEMQRFTAKIVDMMKQEKLYASQGEPIILSQIENEYGNIDSAYGAGGPFIATSYDYDAPIDEYGLVRQPKWGHLRDVHKAIKLCEEELIATDPTISSLGPNLEVVVLS